VSRWVLKNTVRMVERRAGMRIMRAGRVIDDAQEDVARIREAGGILLPEEQHGAQAAFHRQRTRGGDERDVMPGDHGQRLWKGERTGHWKLANGIWVRAHWVQAGTRFNAATDNLQQVLEHGGILYADD
jgi:hypothetical protein